MYGVGEMFCGGWGWVVIWCVGHFYFVGWAFPALGGWLWVTCFGMSIGVKGTVCCTCFLLGLGRVGGFSQQGLLWFWLLGCLLSNFRGLVVMAYRGLDMVVITGGYIVRASCLGCVHGYSYGLLYI